MLEGNTNTSYWDWKNSIGPLKDRPGFAGVWKYLQTNGIGLMEYLNFAEDLEMDIILAVYSGLSLNGDLASEDNLQPFIDDALDEIEFIVGPPDSKWGAVRASLGHPEPFKLESVEVGNEDWLAGRPAGWDAYKRYRFPRFLEAINAKYPNILVISSGSVRDGYQIPSPGAGDYHIYGTPDSMVNQFNLFDNITIPHIIGEAAAVHPNGGIGWNGSLIEYSWWGGALAEAVELLGYERNCKTVIGQAYVR
jgi:alpha-L-arabinofuranosidase